MKILLVTQGMPILTFNKIIHLSQAGAGGR